MYIKFSELQSLSWLYALLVEKERKIAPINFMEEFRSNVYKMNIGIPETLFDEHSVTKYVSGIIISDVVCALIQNFFNTSIFLYIYIVICVTI